MQILWFIVLIAISDSQWILQSDHRMPKAADQMAVGYYNGTIYLMYVLQICTQHNTMTNNALCLSTMIRGGDSTNRHQLIEYDIATETFNDLEDDYLESTLGNNVGEYGTGVYYTQIDATTLYTISRTGAYISAYDLESDSVSWNRIEPDIPYNVGKYACIASSNTPSPRLYITGGDDDDVKKRLQIYDLDSNSWLESDSIPQMRFIRDSHGCTVVNNRLFVMGHSTKIEAINITDIMNQSWTKMGLLPPSRPTLEEFGVAAVDHMIYIIGGTRDGGPVDTVYTIDTDTDAVTLHGEPLPYPVHGMSVVVVDGIVYGFGGKTGGTPSDQWMTLDLLSDQFLQCALCMIREFF